MMKHLWIVLMLGLLISPANASNVVNQRYIDQLTKGGMTSIKRAAQSIYKTNLRDTEVLDVAAEVLLQRYPAAASRDIDSLAWVCRALGHSRNPRYHSTLNEVNISNSSSKLRKYAKKALNELGGAGGEQYTKGTIDLATVRSSGKKSGVTKKVAAPVAPSQSGKQNLDIIREGMSREEVHSLIGYPTATSSHQTGKAFNPFNFKGGDVVRTIDLYKNKGRVVFSNTSAYSSGMRVLEVIVDPNESGYP
jgi:hypothetical protein